MNGHDARRLEWQKTDGLGGFASGTVSGMRTRRYPRPVDLGHAAPRAGRECNSERRSA